MAKPRPQPIATNTQLVCHPMGHYAQLVLDGKAEKRDYSKEALNYRVFRLSRGPARRLNNDQIIDLLHLIADANLQHVTRTEAAETRLHDKRAAKRRRSQAPLEGVSRDTKTISREHGQRLPKPRDNDRFAESLPEVHQAYDPGGKWPPRHHGNGREHRSHAARR